MKQILMCGFRKGAKSSNLHDLNGMIFSSEKEFVKRMSYIDTSEDKSNWIFKGTYRLTTSDILDEIERGPLWCESKFFCYLFKLI